MRQENSLKKVVRSCDAFGRSPTLYYRGEARLTSVSGCISTVLIGAVLLGVMLFDILSYEDVIVS